MTPVSVTLSGHEGHIGCFQSNSNTSGNITLLSMVCLVVNRRLQVACNFSCFV